MRRRTLVPSTIVLTALLVTGCANDTAAPMEDTAGLIALNLGGPRPRPQTWVDGELFDGVVTPATFNPASDAFDELYTGGNGFKSGVPLISESKPGDQDYNGGRWHLNVLKGSVAKDKYANASSVEDLILADFQPTTRYFECPLLPRRDRN